jgi:hypothetical protein
MTEIGALLKEFGEMCSRYGVETVAEAVRRASDNDVRAKTAIHDMAIHRDADEALRRLGDEKTEQHMVGGAAFGHPARRDAVVLVAALRAGMLNAPTN